MKENKYNIYNNIQQLHYNKTLNKKKNPYYIDFDIIKENSYYNLIKNKIVSILSKVIK